MTNYLPMYVFIRYNESIGFKKGEIIFDRE